MERWSRGDTAGLFGGMRRRKGNVAGNILPIDLSSLPYLGKFVADFHQERTCRRAAEGKRSGEKGNKEKTSGGKKKAFIHIFWVTHRYKGY